MPAGPGPDRVVGHVLICFVDQPVMEADCYLLTPTIGCYRTLKMDTGDMEFSAPNDDLR
ncbi:hypothetical protein TrVFT333_008221 [Trichoderma virens FT-333]|nr:hypothetical protein TrVFT333_008221 [Trichoderma virens FT-333]